MTIISPFEPSWYVNSGLRAVFRCEVTTIQSAHEGFCGETVYLHQIHHPLFDRIGYPLETLTQLCQTYPSFRMRFK